MAGLYSEAKREALTSFVAFTEGGDFPKWPLEVFIEVSNICDLQCAMCPTFSALNIDRFFALRREDRGVIAYDTATQPLDDVLKHALIIHASGYGEPTIHPQYKEMLRYLGQYEALIDFFTNGMHLDQELCDVVVEERIHRVSISFSGVTAEEYENIYIGGDFERVLANIKRLSDTKKRNNSSFPRIEINSIAFRHHIDRLPEFVELMGKAGADVIHIKPLRVFAGKIKELKHHESHMHPDREAKLVEQAKAIAKQYGVHLASKPYEHTQQKALDYERVFDAMPDPERAALFEKVFAEMVPVEQMRQVAFSAEKRSIKKAQASGEREMFPRALHKTAPDNFIDHKGSPCLEPFKTMHAAFDGRVRPCCFTGSHDWLGHLDDSSAAEIWQAEPYQVVREQIIANRYLNTMCVQCLRKSSYPKHHDLQARYRTYNKWFEERYHTTFAPELAERIQQVANPGQIIAKQRARMAASVS